MGIGADQRVGVKRRRPGAVFVNEHDARQVLQVHLVHDAGVGRHHLEIPKGILAPAQKDIPFFVPAKLQLGVALERLGGAEVIDLHRVIDHQFRGL